jgi:putative transposase
MTKYTYRFRLYPTEEQKIFLNKSIGCVRFVCNYLFSKAKEDYKDGKKWNRYEYKKLLLSLKNNMIFLMKLTLNPCSKQ